jgi:hypothetical protein
MARSAVLPKKAGKKDGTQGARSKAVPKDEVDIGSVTSELLKLEGAERAKTGSQNCWLSLATGNTGLATPKDPRYVKGTNLLDYVIAEKKLVLGPEFDATILGMFKLYQESTQKKSESDLPSVVGFWMPEDAEKLPLGENNFTREFVTRDGSVHELNPIHWVALYIHGHEEVTDVILSFRGKGNEFYRELFKTVKRESRICTELRFRVSSQAVANEKYRKTDYYPQFDIEGHNFLLDEDGGIKNVKGGLSQKELAEVLTRSHAVQKDYAASRMVGKKNVAAITGAKQAALPPGKDGYGDVPDDDDDEELEL